MRKKQFSYFSFQNFFGFRAKIFWLLAKKLQEVFKTTFYVSRGTVCGLKFFSKFLNRFGFSAETFGMVFKFYLRVQSKNCGRNSFFCFSSQSFFSKTERKFFRLLAKKFQKVVKTNFCVSTGTTCGFNFFLKSFEPLWIFCRILWHGSQNSIYVSRVKFAEEIFFFILPFWIFPDFERKFFRTFGQKTSRICQNFLLRVQRNNLWLEFIFKFRIVSDFLQKPLAWFSKFYLRVQSKNCGKKLFFASFSEIFRILCKIFSDFRPKNFKKLWKLTSACPQEQLVALNFFKKFWTVLDFLQNSLAWFSNFYLRVQSKTCGRKSFLIFLFGISVGFWAKIFSDFWPKNFKKFSKLPSTCPEEQFVAWNFSLKFWTVLDFLQERLAWFSKFYLGVQSKNCRRISFFFVFLFRVFSNFERYIFRLLAKKLQKISKLSSACPEEQFVPSKFFKKFWTVIDFLQKPLALFSKFYLRVQSKNCGRNSFPIFLFRIFSDFEQKFSDFWPKNFKKFSKLPSTCPEEQFVAWNFFLNFWIVLDFLQKPLAWFSNSIYVSRVKIAEEIVFSVFLLRVFFSKTERKFFRLLAKKLQKVVKTNFCVSTGTTCGFNFFLKSFEPLWIFCRILWHGSQNSIYVSRVKFAEEIFFLFFLSEFFRTLSENFFGLLAKKRQEFVKISFYVSRGTICGLNLFLSFESFPIFCRNHWLGSQNSIYVSRVKIAEKNFFLLPFQKFFGFCAKYFQTFGQKTSKSCEN